MNIPKSTQFTALQLQCLKPTFYVTLNPSTVGEWGEGWVRLHVSRLNTIHKTYLQCHKNKDGSLTIWHNPEKKEEQNKSAQFDKLIWLRKQMNDLKMLKEASKDPNAFLAEMIAVQENIDSTLLELRYTPGEPRKRRGNSIRQPLPVILEFYGIGKDIWDILPPKVQTRKRIQAEVVIKDRRRAEEGNK